MTKQAGLPASIDDASPSMDDDQFARWLAAGQGQAVIQPRAAAGPAPLSFGQERLWFLGQLRPGDPDYNVPIAVRLRGPLHREVLRRGIDVLVTRHTILRASLAAEGGRPVQRTMPAPPRWPLPYADLSGLPPGARQAALHAALCDWAIRPFALRGDMLFRTGLWRLAQDDHTLLLCAHHIVFDAWSVTVLLRELALIYPALLTGRAPALPDLPIQYSDFAAWQREHFTGSRQEHHLAFWQEQLAGAPEVLALPSDLPRRSARSGRGGRHEFVLSPQTSAGLHHLARRKNATLFMALLSAFAVMLFRYTGQDDVVVGTAVAGRDRPETESLVGFLVNTLPLRLKLSGDPAFEEVLAQARDVALAAYEHAGLPFEKLVERLRPERDGGRPPLVQALLLVQNSLAVPPRIGETAVSIADVPTGTAKFDLSLGFWEQPSGLHGTITYKSDLFSPRAIQDMTRRLTILLENVISTSAHTRISELPLVTAAEIGQLTAAGSVPADGVAPGGVSAAIGYAGLVVGDLLAEHRDTRRDVTAVTWEDGELSYDELHRQADRIAARLRELGAGPDVPVGVNLPRSGLLVAAMVAVLSAGAAYVPLDPDLPPGRLKFIADDANVRIVLTDGGTSFETEAVQVGIDAVQAGITEAEGRPAREGNPATREGNPATREGNLACITYTSGSTGRPAGVMITNGNLVPILTWAREELYGNSPLRTLHNLAMSLDGGILELLIALSTGSTIIIPGRAERESPSRLLGFCARNAVEVLYLTASQLAELCQVGGELPHLRLLHLAGGDFPWKLADQARRLVPPDCRIVNGYGPAENSVFSTYAAVGENRNDHRTPLVPIGRVSGATRSYVLDPRMRPVPAGIIGELYVGGPGVARGYLRQPALTAGSFVPDPFSPVPGLRLYRTGDLVRRLPDGDLVFLGRNDRQLKIKGFTIELGEIEATLAGHAQVAECICRAVAESVVAYVASPAADRLTAGELDNYLAGKLPYYMMPSAYVIVREFPRGMTGETDVSLLGDPSRLAEDTQTPVRRSVRTETERRLAAIWADALGRDEVMASDNFFELGGHSLLAARIVERISEEYGIDVPLLTVFETETLEELAEKMDELNGE